MKFVHFPMLLGFLQRKIAESLNTGMKHAIIVAVTLHSKVADIGGGNESKITLVKGQFIHTDNY